jgi:2-C-methyl-D-erythritol 4-phosphate cytidylyltransferase
MSGKVIAVVPAAGSGVRFGPGTNKTLSPLLGKPVLVWTLQALASVPEISEIIPVLREPDIEECMKLIEEHGIPKVKKVVPGGEERQDSVRNGLKNVNDEDAIVLVHDGVRPLIDESIVGKVIAGLAGYDGCVCAVAPKDTIKEIAQDGAIVSTPSREKLLAVQTPQAFAYATIMEAYRRASRACGGESERRRRLLPEHKDNHARGHACCRAVFEKPAGGVRYLLLMLVLNNGFLYIRFVQ